MTGKRSDQFSLLPSLVETLPTDQDGTLEAGSAEVLREAVRTLEVERYELKVRLKQADDALVDLIRKNGEQADRIEESMSRISDLSQQIKTITADREEVRVDARQAHESSRRFERQLEEISRQLTKTSERIEQANDKLGAARREIDRLNERDARVKATASWKLTAPLRFLRRSLIDPFTRKR